jgi:hypothetical protein
VVPAQQNDGDDARDGGQGAHAAQHQAGNGQAGAAQPALGGVDGPEGAQAEVQRRQPGQGEQAQAERRQP